MARAAGRGDPHRHFAVLRHPQRQAAQVPLDQPRRHRRHPHLDARLRRVRALRRELLQLQQDLRLAGRRHGVPALAVDHQPRAAVRRRARRRARTGPRAPGRDARRAHDPAAAADTRNARKAARAGAATSPGAAASDTHGQAPTRTGPPTRPPTREREKEAPHEVREAEQQVREDPLPSARVWSSTSRRHRRRQIFQQVWKHATRRPERPPPSARVGVPAARDPHRRPRPGRDLRAGESPDQPRRRPRSSAGPGNGPATDREETVSPMEPLPATVPAFEKLDRVGFPDAEVPLATPRASRTGRGAGMCRAQPDPGRGRHHPDPSPRISTSHGSTPCSISTAVHAWRPSATADGPDPRPRPA